MHKAQKVFISLLLVAGFASSCSKPEESQPEESQKEKLMAQKERLITEISDLGGPLLVYPAQAAPPLEEKVKFIKLVLTALCSALETQEVTDIDLEGLVLEARTPADTRETFRAGLLFFINGTDGTGIASGLIELIRQRYPGEDTRIEIIYNKMQDLMKVMKQIRELK